MFLIRNRLNSLLLTGFVLLAVFGFTTQVQAINTCAYLFREVGVYESVRQWRALETTLNSKEKAIFSAFSSLKKRIEDANLNAETNMYLLGRLRNAIQKKEKLKFAFAGFPSKSPNVEEKVLGDLPDMAEQISIQRLGKFVKVVNENYEYGAELIIISDGRAFTGTWWSSDARVDLYIHALRDMIQELGYGNYLKIATMEDIFKGSSDEIRKQLMDNFAPSKDQVKKSLSQDPNRMKLYLALKRFVQEDVPSQSYGDMSKTAIEKLAGERALEDMVRNDAFSAFTAHYYSGVIRFSVHPQARPDKIGINILTDSGHGGTPWHGVAVRSLEGDTNLLKRKDVDLSRNVLVYRNGQPYYFQELQDPMIRLKSKVAANKASYTPADLKIIDNMITHLTLFQKYRALGLSQEASGQLSTTALLTGTSMAEMQKLFNQFYKPLKDDLAAARLVSVILERKMSVDGVLQKIQYIKNLCKEGVDVTVNNATASLIFMAAVHGGVGIRKAVQFFELIFLKLKNDAIAARLSVGGLSGKHSDVEVTDIYKSLINSGIPPLTADKLASSKAILGKSSIDFAVMNQKFSGLIGFTGNASGQILGTALIMAGGNPD